MTERLTQQSTRESAMDDDEVEYTTRLPSSARRYGGIPPPPRTSTRLPVPRHASAIQRASVVQTQGLSSPQRRFRIQLHPLTLLGIILLFFVGGWWMLIQI